MAQVFLLKKNLDELCDRKGSDGREGTICTRKRYLSLHLSHKELSDALVRGHIGVLVLKMCQYLRTLGLKGVIIQSKNSDPVLISRTGKYMNWYDKFPKETIICQFNTSSAILPTSAGLPGYPGLITHQKIEAKGAT
jgi:hypothetical protein